MLSQRLSCEADERSGNLIQSRSGISGFIQRHHLLFSLRKPTPMNALQHGFEGSRTGTMANFKLRGTTGSAAIIAIWTKPGFQGLPRIDQVPKNFVRFNVDWTAR